jgi:DNA-binding NarL/FixJ family response regulator
MQGMEPKRLTVLIGVESDAIRASIRHELERERWIVVAEASDGDEALDLALETRPAMCLIDLSMPGESGLRAASVIARVLDSTSVVLLADHPGVGDVLEAMRAGAAGCLSTDMDPRRLPGVLRAVADGDSAFPGRELRQALDFLVPQVA